VFGEIFDDESVFTLCTGLVNGDTIDIYLEGEGKVDKVSIDKLDQSHVLKCPILVNEGDLGNEFVVKEGEDINSLPNVDGAEHS